MSDTQTFYSGGCTPHHTTPLPSCCLAPPTPFRSTPEHYHGSRKIQQRQLILYRYAASRRQLLVV
ncbi:hypothetical protein E2C01_025968 [Portunus trituberculatus]|uniref:Uncharacterized protein n=1 Tax=Portunus trituberculatus TaxID=210409 RepID=A0A5B7EH57_PORTR|nr:hypothetical protein [Portunus trituberculatus]